MVKKELEVSCFTKAIVSAECYKIAQVLQNRTMILPIIKKTGQNEVRLWN
jgi:hypothetical protein